MPSIYGQRYSWLRSAESICQDLSRRGFSRLNMSPGDIKPTCEARLPKPSAFCTAKVSSDFQNFLPNIYPYLKIATLISGLLTTWLIWQVLAAGLHPPFRCPGEGASNGWAGQAVKGTLRLCWCMLLRIPRLY